MTRVGVDEAGKGPVLGSLFAAAVAAPPDTVPEAVDDSKALDAATRERLDGRLRADPAVRVAVAEVGVDRIDDPATDMNGLTVAAHAEALAALHEGEGETGTDPPAGPVLCDAGDVDADRFARRVADRLDGAVPVRAVHRADETDPLVAAASIIAKTARERHVDGLRERHGAVGSGYPSDPTTRTFLREYVATHDRLPACARRSWATSEDVLAANDQAALEDF